MSAIIIPTMRYHDAPKMIEWLCECFGFSRHLVVEDGQDGIAHAQLVLGNAMVMLGSARDDAFGCHQKTATALGGNSQSAYIVVADVDLICTRARAAGAEIVMEPTDQSYGGRVFSCLDPEGQLWSFGSYNPWTAEH